MADEGTAVLEPEATADPVVEAPPEDLPETEATESPETDGAVEETPDSDTEAEPKSYTEDEVKKLVEAELAKERESHRRKLDNEKAEAERKARAAAFTQRLSQAATNLRGGLYQTVGRGLNEWQQVAKRAWDEGKDAPALNPQWLAGLMDAAARNAFDEQSQALHESFEGYLSSEYPDFKPDRELANRLADAVHRGDPDLINNARVAYMEAAIVSKLTPKLRKQVEEELSEADANGNRVARTKAADERNKSQPRPTQVAGGGASPVVNTMADADREYSAGRLTHEQYKGYRQRFGIR